MDTRDGEIMDGELGQPAPGVQGGSQGDRIGRMAQDERYDCAARADARARANKPKHLLIIAGIVFVIAAGFFGTAARRQSTATADLAAQQRLLEQLIEGLAEEGALLSIINDPDRDSGDAWLVDAGTPRPLVELERLQNEAGIDEIDPVPDERTTRQSGYNEVSFEYAVRDNDLTELLTFVRSATDEGTGPSKLRLGSLSIEPDRERDRWTMRVEFVRYEKRS